MALSKLLPKHGVWLLQPPSVYQKESRRPTVQSRPCRTFRVHAGPKREEGFDLPGTGRPIDSLTINREVSSPRPTTLQPESPEELASDKEDAFKAVVVGAGPAGALTALLLAEVGFQVDVFEKADEDKVLNVTLTTRGLYAAREAGVEALIRSVGVRERGQLVIVDQKGVSYREYKHESLSIAVTDLASALVEEGKRRFPDAIRYHHGWRLESGKLGTNEAWFTRHTQRVGLGAGVDTLKLSADILVGADGTDSKVRKLMEAQVPGYKSRLECEQAGRCVRAEVPEHLRSPDGKSKYTPPSKQGRAKLLLGDDLAYIFRQPRWVAIRPAGKGTWCFTFMGMKRTLPARVASEVEENYPELAELFSPTSRAADDLATAPELQQCSLRTTTYHHKQTVLIGNAAHALRNHLPLAADFTLEDCVLLRSLLKDHLAGVPLAAAVEKKKLALASAVIAALSAYNEDRKSEMDGMVALSEELVEQKTPWSIFKGNTMGLLHRFIPALRPWQNSLFDPKTDLHKIPGWRVQEDLGVGALLAVTIALSLAVTLRVVRAVLLKK